jgi:hypothetical protein
MAHRTIELLIGRLITDEAFRAEFLHQPEVTLLGLRERGLDVSLTEIAALVATDRGLWTRAADALDPRLQKVGFQNEARNA